MVLGLAWWGGAIDLDSIPSGANGVSGFLPDILRKIKIYPDNPSNGVYTAEIPDDGYLFYEIVCGSNAPGAFYVGYLDYPSFGKRYDIPINEYIIDFLMVRRGYPIKITLKNPAKINDLYFYPIYKPDFTQEHIVGYLGDKPIYEIIHTGFASNVVGLKGNQIVKSNVFDSSKQQIVSMSVSVQTSGNSIISAPTYYNVNDEFWTGIGSGGNWAEQHTHSVYNNAYLVLKLQYTKTN